MATKKRIVILGGGGFVGRVLTNQLKKTPHHISSIKRAQGDLRDPQFCKRVLKGKDVVYYLAAARKNVSEHTARPFDFISDNSQPLLTVLETLKHQPPKTFLYVSSVLADYASSQESVLDGYVVAKAFGEIAVRAFAKQTGWNVVIIRSAAVYGPETTFDPKTANVIPAMIDRIKKSSSEMVIWGTGKRKLQFIHVEDLAANLVKAGLQKTQTLITIGNPEIVSINKLAAILMKKMKKDLRVKHDTSKPDKPTKLFTFQNLVQPKWKLDKGLDSLLYG